MNSQEAHNIIRTRFNTLIEVAQSLDTHYDNQAKDKPEVSTDPVGLRCRFSIKDGESVQTTVGKNATERTPGVAFAELFCPIGKGNYELLAMAVIVKDAFKRTTVSSVVFKTPSVIQNGRVETKSGGPNVAEWKVTVQIPYHFDDTTTG